MAFYERMAATATRLLGNYGQPMALRRVSGATDDPATGETTGGVPTDMPTVGVFTSISADYAAANQVLAGDRLVVLDASQEPLMGDRLVAGGHSLAIVRIEPINPAGTPLAYRLQVRS